MFCCAAERRRSTPAPKEEEKVNEEQWPLREVVFVEDVKNVPVGKVGGASGPPSQLCSLLFALCSVARGTQPLLASSVLFFLLSESKKGFRC